MTPRTTTAPPRWLRHRPEVAPPAVDDGWAQYVEALGAAHTARQVADRARDDDRRRSAEHAAQVRDLTDQLLRQGERVAALAARLGAPLMPTPVAPSSLTPTPVAPTASPTPMTAPRAVAEARARLTAADAALAEAERVGRLPQLLPQWTSRPARAAIVYLLAALPSVVLTALLSVAGVRGSQAVLIWFAVAWPLVTAIGGALVLRRFGEPRLPPEEPVDPVAAVVARRRPRLYPWLGVLIAWAAWLVPGWILDQLASLTG